MSYLAVISKQARLTAFLTAFFFEKKRQPCWFVKDKLTIWFLCYQAYQEKARQLENQFQAKRLTQQVQCQTVY